MDARILGSKLALVPALGLALVSGCLRDHPLYVAPTTSASEGESATSGSASGGSSSGSTSGTASGGGSTDTGLTAPETTDTAAETGPVPYCGDGNVDPGEACDDGDGVDDNACTNACTTPTCGDGVVQAFMGETCDDGNDVETDGCMNGCLLPPAAPVLLGGNIEMGMAIGDVQGSKSSGCAAGSLPIGIALELQPMGYFFHLATVTCSQVQIGVDDQGYFLRHGPQMEGTTQMGKPDLVELPDFLCPMDTYIVSLAGAGDLLIRTLAMKCSKIRVRAEGGKYVLELVDGRQQVGPIGKVQPPDVTSTCSAGLVGVDLEIAFGAIAMQGIRLDCGDLVFAN